MQGCYDVTREIGEWAVMTNNWLVATHISGKLNNLADKLSRSLTVNTE